MANMFRRAMFKILPMQKFAQQNRCASFTARQVFTENLGQTGTIFFRFAKHLALENRKTLEAPPTTIKYADYYPISNLHQFDRQLRSTTAEQLPALIIFSYTYRPLAHPHTFAEILNKIDAAALKLLPQMSDEVILHTLYALLFLMPSWINLMDFYRASVQKLASMYLDDHALLTKDKFVQLVFYYGLDKKNSSSSANNFKNMLEKCLPQYLQDLSNMDLAIICNSTYKAAIVIDDPEFNKRIMQEIKVLELSESSQADLLITYTKTLRLQRFKSAELCQQLSTLCENENFLKKLPVSGLTHIFAVFAERLWNHKASMQAIVKVFMSTLGDVAQFDSSEKQNNKFRQAASTAANAVRCKDIDKFLWCCAQLNYNLSQAQLQHLETILLQKVQREEFNAFPDQLVDSCLSLWMLGFKSKALYEQAELLKEQRTPKRHQPKVDTRLTVLQTAVAIEQPSWLPGSAKLKLKKSPAFDLENMAPAYLLNLRADLVATAQKLSAEDEVKETKIIAPFAGINIPSILVKFEKNASEALLVELLTKKQMLHFDEEPASLIRLKLHFCHVLAQKVLVLREKDLLNNNFSIKHLIDDLPVAETLKAKSAQKI